MKDQIRRVWSEQPLESLLTFVTSGSRGWAKYYAESGSAFLRIQNVGRNSVHAHDVAFVNPPKTAEADRTRVKAGDVLLSITADLGRTGVVPSELEGAYINQHLAILRVKGIHPPYLSAFLSSPMGQARVLRRNRHGVKAGLNFDDIKSIRIPLPPFSTQHRIANVLDRAEALRAKRREALAHLNTLAPAIFSQEFGDPRARSTRFSVVPLERICTRITDGTHQSPQWTASGIPFLFVANIVKGEIDFETEKFISHETHSDLTKRCPIEIGDVLYSTVGSYGVPALVKSRREFAFQRHIAHLKPDRSRVVPEFLHAMLAASPLRAQADRAARGVAQKTVNLADIRRFCVFQPPILVQQEFARRIAAIEHLKAAHRASLAELDALFASLQHRAFRGEL